MKLKCFEFFPTLETERLVLRKIIKKDIEEIYQIFSDPEVAKYDWFYPLTAKEEALKFIERYEQEYKEQEEITWGIALKETNKLIGTCCLGSFEEAARRGEIGYDFMQNEWNKGYATEAIKAVVNFGLKDMHLNRIEAFITPGNEASTKVLEKSSFTKEGLVRERDLIKNKLEDGIVMAILQKDVVNMP